jgi:predicted  nucleic acid-binding Zn-ribbon protein
MAEDIEALDSGAERLPRPDPTRLTTAALQREIAAVRERIEAAEVLMEAKLSGAIGGLVARLDAMDTALKLIQAASDKIPSELDLKMGQLKALYEEKFSSVLAQERSRSEAIHTLRESERVRLEGHESSHSREHAMQQEAANKTERTIREALAQLEKQMAQQFDAIKEGYRERALYLEAAINKAEQFVQARFREMESSISASTEKSASAVASLRAELLPQITGERTRGDMGVGRQMGQGAMIALIFSAIGALSVIVGFVVLLTRMA